MANVFTYQILRDTTEHTTIKLTGLFSGSDGQESNVVRIQANSLYGAMDSNRTHNLVDPANTGALPYYGLYINRLWYDCPAGNGNVELFWNADIPRTIFQLNGNAEYDGQGNWIVIPNDSRGTANSKGDIGIVTRGMEANDCYTLVVELRKDNTDYQRGQFNDPAAFNYTPYNILP
jgi:hypothetical protein